MGTWVYDCETLPNRTLVCAKEVDTGERFEIWRHEEDAPARLRQFFSYNHTFVGFNSFSFDNVIVAAFSVGKTEQEIKQIANDIIDSRVPQWQVMKKYGLSNVIANSIDLIEVAPSFVGLKAYGARMHMPLLQDMPIAHDQHIEPHQEETILMYCRNDLETTLELMRQLDGELTLRTEMSRRYRVDMRSKSDSQMAEWAYIASLNLQRRDNQVPRTIGYKPPSFLRFNNKSLNLLLERVSTHVFDMRQDTGHVVLPEFLVEPIAFGGGTYQLGVGGIHSTHDKKVCHVAEEGFIIQDIDAASFYPSIILECGFVPENLGEKWIAEYRKIYNQRLEAKKSGDKVTNETLKISLNGTFGKLASKYSVLYAPDLMLAVTLTGQFTLLMLIEWLEIAGVSILSANTDGIAVKYPEALKETVARVVAKFGEVSGFDFEFTDYRVLAMKDVNNYLAVKTDRSVKAKGIYAPLSLRKNPSAGVCARAVGEWLAKGVPFKDTLLSAPFTDFLSARNVTGGGMQGDEYLGKVVRWYMSTEELPPLTYAKNGNRVPKTEGARACMNLPEGIPDDLHWGWYLNECIRIAIDCGCSNYLTSEELGRVVKVKKSKPKKEKQ